MMLSSFKPKAKDKWG